jgi:hypothetical protein
MGLISSPAAPMGINEFVGLGVLADWVVVASYSPKSRCDVSVSDDSDDEDIDYFEELLVFVRNEDPDEGSGSPPGPFPNSPDPALRTMVLLADDNCMVGMMGLPLHLQELLDVIAAGRITKVLRSHGFITNYDV